MPVFEYMPIFKYRLSLKKTKVAISAGSIRENVWYGICTMMNII